MAKKGNEVAKRQPTSSERFTSAVMREFQGNVGTVVIDDSHRRFIQGYFVALDNTLTTLEEKRLSKSENYRDPVPLTWENINLKKLSVDVVAYANMGLNPIHPNHINLIPYKNKRTGQYDIGFIEGYAGKEIIAKRYALTPPDFAVIELVYSTDEFAVIKKDHINPYDQYKHEITSPFDRGDILGGFYYHVYEGEPTRNKLVVVSYKDILKRKPDHAAPEFWGGEKDEWKDGQRTGKKIKVEGWHEEMCLKTIKRMCWNDIVIDGNKVDDNYKRAKDATMEEVDTRVENTINEKAGAQELTMEIEEKPTATPQEAFGPPETDAEPQASKGKDAVAKPDPEPVKKEAKVDKNGQAAAF